MLQLPQPSHYVVVERDTLTSIAQKFELPNWEIITEQPENKALFSQRNSFDNLQLGDQLFIPPSPIKVLEFKISRLEKLIKDSNKMYNSLIQEMNSEYRKVKQIFQTVDVLAAFTPYAMIVKGGMNAMKLTGKELARANNELAKSAISIAPNFVVEQTLQHSSVLKVSGEESWGVAIPKKLLNLWFDMTSLSYWAQRISGVNINQEHARIIRQLTSDKNSAQHSLKQQINKINK